MTASRMEGGVTRHTRPWREAESRTCRRATRTARRAECGDENNPEVGHSRGGTTFVAFAEYSTWHRQYTRVHNLTTMSVSGLQTKMKSARSDENSAMSMLATMVAPAAIQYSAKDVKTAAMATMESHVLYCTHLVGADVSNLSRLCGTLDISLLAATHGGLR